MIPGEAEKFEKIRRGHEKTRKINELEFDVRYADGTKRRVEEGILIEFRGEHLNLHLGASKLSQVIAAVQSLYELLDAAGLSGEFERPTEIQLAEYVNTGLTPDQIREMDRLYLEKCEELAAERAKNRWIPVDKKLPECTLNVYEEVYTSEVVEVTVLQRKDGKIETSVDFIFDNGEWGACRKDEKVIAWKPLPEPYIPSDKCHGCFGAANNDCERCMDGKYEER